MRRHLIAPNIVTEPLGRVGGWTLLMLDSSVPGVSYGCLGTERAAHLFGSLEDIGDGHALLALHHHPVAVRSPWMDRMALTDSDVLFEAMARSGRVKAVLFGHVHQEVDQLQAGARMLGTPSTCVQFAPHTLTMSLDGRAPAYRWLDLHPDGHLDTGVVYLAAEWLQASA
jgi:Icc protein